MNMVQMFQFLCVVTPPILSIGTIFTVLVSLCCYVCLSSNCFQLSVLVSLCCYSEMVHWDLDDIGFSFFVLLLFSRTHYFVVSFVLVSLCCYGIPKPIPNQNEGFSFFVLLPTTSKLCMTMKKKCFSFFVLLHYRNDSSEGDAYVLVSLCCYGLVQSSQPQ